MPTDGSDTCGDSPTIRVWVRARWRLPDGREVVRTVRRAFPGDPADERCIRCVVEQVVAALEMGGAAFAEGSATMADLLDTETG